MSPNTSSVTEFLLMGFSDEHSMQVLHFVMFLFIYLIAIMGNLIIIIAVALNNNLHTPMYFFLVNLSLSDICFISTTVPKSIAISGTNNGLISFAGCVAQVFLVIIFTGSELTLLTVMAYDRYVAICHPLQYSLIMNRDACIRMTAASWISNLVHAALQTSMTFKLNFCDSNVIQQYFCDVPQLQKISCSDTRVNQVLIFALGMILDSFIAGFIFVSYGYIFSAVLKIQSVQGRHKAFSTCTPHLTVFSLFMVTAVFSYMRPKSLSSPTVDLVSAVLYTVLPPVLNPIIYSLRNKDIQAAVWKIPKQLKNLLT
ncbi:olfactory receptor 14A16-like [Sceloporus undulatus]|uniref:olfactory receptor 14A16-like n=1 Tax=Sceloporus undulatus TaxID=8520 RepID=UPI001C4B2037|nr:olfactory receptor 14A16-like [Sceloporus undulatus]